MTTSNSSVETEVGTNGESVNGQASTEVKLVPEDDYKKAVAFGTTARQAQIELAKRLVEKDKSELKNISDPKVRDAVAKDIYGYADYNEMVAIEGEDSISNSSDSGDDEITILKKQVRTLSYQSEKGALENAISQFKEKNPTLFTTSEADEKLRNSINLISSTLPVKDRIEMAGRIAFQETINSSTMALKALASAQVSANNGGVSGVDNEPSDTEKKTDDIMSFFKLKK